MRKIICVNLVWLISGEGTQSQMCIRVIIGICWEGAHREILVSDLNIFPQTYRAHLNSMHVHSEVSLSMQHFSGMKTILHKRSQK